MSLNGNLFYYDPSLGEKGAMRQLFTRTVEVDGKQDYELCVTGAVNELPRKLQEKPQAPTWWTYVKAFFRIQSARDEIQTYQHQLAEYHASNRMWETFSRDKEGLASVIENPIFPFAGGKEAPNEEKKAAKAQEKEASNEQKEVVNEQKEAVNEQKEAPNEEKKAARGLNPYDKNMSDIALHSLSFTEKSIPANNLGLNGDTLGALVVMALGSPDLSITIGTKEQKEIVANNPDVNYPKIMGKYEQNQVIAKRGTSAGFMIMARRAAADGIKAAGEGNYTLLAKLIADGLIQNNKVLMGCKELDDHFTFYATMGARVLQVLNKNPDLAQAVKEQLGDNVKQLDIANAAKNINNLRTEAQTIYQKITKEYGQKIEHPYTDPKTNEQKIRVDNAVRGTTTDMAKVVQLFLLDVQMKNGELNLETTKYAQDGVVEKFNEGLTRNDSLNSFLGDDDRVETLMSPTRMKKLCDKAVKELTQQSKQPEPKKEPEVKKDAEIEQKQVEQPKVAP